MGLVTLGSLRTQAKERADMLKSRFIADSEWNSYINLSYAELEDLLIATAEDYKTISATITVDGSQDAVALPANFYKGIGVDYDVSGRKRPMDKFMFRDRNNYQNQTEQNVLRYRFVKNQIQFIPRASAQSFTLWYVPVTMPLVLDSDTMDGVNGFEDYVIVRSAIRALVKEESNPAALMQELSMLKQRVIDMAANRDQGAPERVTDVLRPQYDTNLVGYDGI